MTQTDYTKIIKGFLNQNFISFKNKDAKFSSNIYYCKESKLFYVLLTTTQIICGESFKSIDKVIEFICRNIDSNGTDDNLIFNYNSIRTTPETKGRLFYTLEQENNIKELLLLLLI